MLLSTKTTGGAPDQANRFANDWLVTYQSPNSPIGLTGDITYQACVTWSDREEADFEPTPLPGLEVVPCL